MNKPQATTAPLDDVMLAMDVVDTLRHRQDLVTRELDSEAREKQLIEKLREIYQHQGIEVTDAILREGVAALAESRFVYTPPRPGLGTTLARLYVGRKRWGAAAIALVIVAVLALGGYFLAYKPMVDGQREAARIELAETLPAEMDRIYATIYEETKVQQAVTEAEAIIRRGKTAAAEGDRAGAEAAIAELAAIRDQLRQRYILQVVNRFGENSYLWTFPENNIEATNYYVVVEAIDPDGEVLSLPIRNEESGETQTVPVFAVRVTEALYRAIEQDKTNDGIIQGGLLGAKEEGYLERTWVDGVLDGAITQW